MGLQKHNLVTTRDVDPTQDRNFILATWLRGLYYGNDWFNSIPKHIFMEHYHTILEKFLSNPNTKIKIACLKDDPEVILGYSVCRKSGNMNILDWIFVKSAWRKIGIAKSLVSNDINVVTHLTKMGKSLKPAHCDFNPFV